MRTDIVFTLTGPDRVGIVEEVTRVFLGMGGNVEVSRMARLGGEFAMLMLVSLPAEKVDGLDAAFSSFAEQGYKVTTSATAVAPAAPAGSSYSVEVQGADHEGIIHEIAVGLSRLGINIESMETGTRGAPITGTPLFFMSAVVSVPAELAEETWMAALDEAASQSGVDATVTAAEAE
jgi:glycine cleavage system transcriptional repressor